MLQEYWENIYVTRENILLGETEIFFIINCEDNVSKENCLYGLNYYTENIRKIKCGLKNVVSVINNIYVHLIIVCVLTQDKKYSLHAFNYSGDEAWKFEFKENVIKVMLGECGTIMVSVVNSKGSKIYLLNQFGEVEWERCLEEDISITQTLGQDKLYFYAKNKIGYVNLAQKTIGYINIPEEKFIGHIALWKDYIVAVGTKSMRCYTPKGNMEWVVEFSDARVQSKVLFDEEGNLYFLTTKSELISLRIDGSLRWKIQTRYYANSYNLDFSDDNIMVISESVGEYTIVEILSLEGDRLEEIKREGSVIWMKSLADKYVSFSYDYEYMKGIYINVFQKDTVELGDKITVHIEDETKKDEQSKWKLDWIEEVFEYIKMTYDLYLEEYGRFETLKVVFTKENSPKISFKNKDSWIEIDFLELQYKGENEYRDKYRECYFRDEVVWYEFVDSECPRTLDYIATKVCEKLENEYGVEVLREIRN